MLLGRCRPVREPFPLGPVIEALRATAGSLRGQRLSPLVGALHRFLPELGDVLRPPLPALDDHVAERHRTFRAVAELLSAVGPVLLLLEDLHWQDSVTDEFLRFVNADPPSGVAVLLTYRGEDLEGPTPLQALNGCRNVGTRHVRVRLAPLNRDEVRRLIADLLDEDEVSEEFADLLHGRTAGLPFAVEEVLRLLRQRRDLIQERGHWTRRTLEDLRVPDALRDTIVERLGGCSPAARAVVQAVAVLGEPTTEGRLVAVTALPAED